MSGKMIIPTRVGDKNVNNELMLFQRTPEHLPTSPTKITIIITIIKT